MAHDPLIIIQIDPAGDPVHNHEHIIRGLNILRAMEFIPGIDTQKKRDRETLEHIAVSRYLDCLIHHGYILAYSTIPNSTYTPFRSVKAKGKMMGVSKGFPDIASILYVEQETDLVKTAYVEMKQKSDGAPSKEQKEWISNLNRAVGTKAKICHGFEDAIDFVIAECIHGK